MKPQQPQQPQPFQPPTQATRLLRWFLRDDLKEDVCGDLLEQYLDDCERRSPAYARRRYWYQVLSYARPFAIRKKKIRTQTNPFIMYRSYLISAIRNMVKNKLHASINIAGLTIGMAVAIIIGLWIYDEVTFEKDFPNYSTTARVIQNVTNNGAIDTWWSTPWPLAEELRTHYGDDFRHIVLTSGEYDNLLSYDSLHLGRTGTFAEPGFVDVFSLRITQGTNDLKDARILLSASTAKAFFADADPVGKVMTIDKQLTVTVGGVFEDMPDHSDMRNIQFVAPWQLLYDGTEWMRTMQDPWRPNAFTTYVQIKDNTSFEAASERIRDAKLKKVSAALALKKPQLFLLPMRDWHLRAEFENGVQTGGRIQYVWMFGIVGAFVLLMACINFMNLSTARSEKRAKEIGIRKAVGSLKSQLVSQFLSESVLTAVLCFVLALLLVQLSLPWFNPVADKQMALPWTNLPMMGIAFGFMVVIGLIAGSYPALYLSSIRSERALKGSYKASRSAGASRKVLVVGQFTISVTLIICTAIVFLQIQFAKDRPAGYNKAGLVVLHIGSPQIHTHFDALKQELEKQGAIADMAEASAPTTATWSSSSVFDWQGKDPDLSVDFPVMGVSYDYGKTIGWEIKEGRDFSREFRSDTVAAILNEAAARYIGFEKPTEEQIIWYQQPYKIVGVVKDMIIRSPFESVKPVIYFLSTEQENVLIARLNPHIATSKAIGLIEQELKKYDAEMPFSYEFTDDAYGQKFGAELRIGKLASIFTTLAIFISCLGVFGLSSFMAEQRTKEIGVRKVLGASLTQLWLLMSKDFMLLVVLSCIIAVPVAYWLVSSWLEGYYYRIDLPWWTFIAAAAGTILITLITVSWHTLHAATVNPVRSLRTE